MAERGTPHSRPDVTRATGALPPEIENVALLGWRCYPCSPTSRAGCVKGATDRATAGLGQLARWAAEFPGCNWRVVMEGSGIWGLDLDTPPGHAHDGVANFAALVKVHGHLPPRPTLRSGGGGLAIFFRHGGEEIAGASGRPAPGIDPRRGRQSQTIPPSAHIVTGRPYRWLAPPWEVPPPAAPAWLLRLVAPPPGPSAAPVVASTDMARRRLYRAALAVLQAGRGERNDVLNRRAYHVGTLIAAGLLGEREAASALYGAAREAGLGHAEAAATVRSGVAAGVRRPAGVHRG